MLAVAALLVAVAAGARGTWSPCGLSMLSTITPLGERGRGNAYATTARWYVAGAGLGGVTLGASAAAGATAVHALGPSRQLATAIAAVASLVALMSDARLGGFQLPFHRRQVNERWLDEFRSWVYGAGFGFQIGTGLGTYITSAANYLLVVLVVLTGSWPFALVAGTVFGLTRGVSVYLTRNVRSAADLVALHGQVQHAGPRVRVAVVLVEALVSAALAGTALGPGVAIGVLVACIVAWFAGQGRHLPACSLDVDRHVERELFA